MLIVWENAMRLYQKKLSMPQYSAYAGDEEAKDWLFNDCLKQAAMEIRTQGRSRCNLQSR